MLYGWDISTSFIGLTVLTQSGSFVEADHLDLTKVETDLIKKSRKAEQYIYSLVNRYLLNAEPQVHYVEDRLSNFASGRTMLQTLMKLAAFNATVSYVIFQQFKSAFDNVEVHHLHPSTVKGIMRKQGLIIPKGADKKLLTLEWVSNREPEFQVALTKTGKPKPGYYDRSDAYIVAKAGYIQGCKSNAK